NTPCRRRLFKHRQSRVARCCPGRSGLTFTAAETQRIKNWFCVSPGLCVSQRLKFFLMTLDFRRSAPEPLAPVSFDIARPFQDILGTGLRVVIFETERLPIVSSRLALSSGDVNDPAGSTGLTSAMAAQLTEGTKNYSSRQLAEKVERLGASLSASASDDFTIVAASTLSLYSSDILEMMAEVVR